MVVQPGQRGKKSALRWALIHSNFFHFFMIVINMLMGTLDAAEMFCSLLLCVRTERPHDLVFTLTCSVSYTVFQNHVALIELTGQLKWKSSNIFCERNKKTKPLCFVFCPFICATYICSNARYATHFQKQLQTLKKKFIKGQWTYSVLAGNYGSSWGSYGTHAEMYPLINMYEGCDTFQKQLNFLPVPSPDLPPLNT